MSSQNETNMDAGLILAAEDCPSDSFAGYHAFSTYDDIIIRKLSAHGPVLIRGGRGSGKSALLIESLRRMRSEPGVLPIYVSLRYLPLLQSEGDEYINHFCRLLSQKVQDELKYRGLEYDFEDCFDQMSLQIGLGKLALSSQKRIVLLFDDAAHIGREKPLEVFFDLFRTLSSNLTSCKASIYPGVTKFGMRFDVFNDSTVIDIGRSDISLDKSFFPDVVRVRYPKLAEQRIFSERFSPNQFANLLGRAVVGNVRGFILACNRFEGVAKIGIPEINKCLLEMATDYFWPLMEEVTPKLGVYEPLIEPARMLMEQMLAHVANPDKEKLNRPVVQDRVLIHRQVASKFGKILEILEYLGFLARREASRAMKSGGRGPVYAINLCNLLDSVPSRRLTFEMIEEWIDGTPSPAEFHVSSDVFHSIKLPQLPDEQGLAILNKAVAVLGRSQAYPYGLTSDLVSRLDAAGISTVGKVASATDEKLDSIAYVGEAKIKRIRDVVFQAIWM
jgi:hypothetical protein